MPTKDEVGAMYQSLKSWRRVANTLGIPKMTAWRYAKDPDYEPKSRRLRKALGLEPYPKVDVVLQVRNPDGTFTKRKGRTPKDAP